MRTTMLRMLAVALLALPSIFTAPAAAAPCTVQPGTVSISVGNETFQVTTDRTIVIDLAFASPSLLEGSVDVAGGQSANVKVYWRKAGLTVFDARVNVAVRFRYEVPQPYQAQQETGHSEK